MIPLVDVHCHLFAGLDDGPRSDEEVFSMCRLACQDGVQGVVAVAHQGERWLGVTAERIRGAHTRLRHQLQQWELPLVVYPAGEVMVWPELLDAWQRGELLAIADASRYLLIELPAGVYIDARVVARDLVAVGVRPILAHAERSPELLDQPSMLQELIRSGCLIQVNANSVTAPASGRQQRALKHCVRRGLIHLVGSDGHSSEQRPPGIAGAYERILSWAGSTVAERLCSANGLAVLQGLAPDLNRPRPRWKWLGT